MRTTLLTLLSFFFLSTQAQQPHRELGYDKTNNLLTTIAFGYGNTVDKIIYSGRDQTLIKVNSYGFPSEMVNSVATVGFQYAGTRSVTVTQTVNGQTKKSDIALDSDKVLSYREEYKKFNQNPSGIAKIDDFLSKGGAKLIGRAVDLVTRDVKNGIGICFDEALNAAKQTQNPIIPVSTLEELSRLTNIPSLGDLVSDGYNELTENIADFFYKRAMDKYNAQKEANRTQNEARLELANVLLAEGHSPEEVSQLLRHTPATGQNSGQEAATPSHQGADSGRNRQDVSGGLDVGSGQATAPVGNSGPSAAGIPTRKQGSLETAYFYFDNPDGTIESFPEYTYPALRSRMLSISSSRYATPVKTGQLDGGLKQYEHLLNLFFGRQTRTTVFVFDGQESAQAAMMTTMLYSSSILGLWAALEEGMREKFSRELTKANIPHTTSATWKDAIKQGKPEELMFNGHEGGRIVNKIDLSNSWLSLMAGANIEIVLDNYFYYDQDYDKLVGVVFCYSNISNPKGKYEAAAQSAVKAISSFMGYADPTTGNTTLASMFEHRDMIDYFKQHFHLKKPSPPGNEKCVATFVGTPQDPAIELCGDTVCISIQCLISQDDDTGTGGQQPPTEAPEPPVYISDPPIGEPNPPVIGQEPPTEELAGAPTTHSSSKYAVIGQLNHASIEKPFAENDKYIYFMQASYEDNAVLAIDKSSGQLSEVVPGKRKADRPAIISIGAHGNDLYLDVEGRGVVRYNGKDVQTSELIHTIDRGFMDSFKKIVLSPNGRFLAYAGQNCHGYVFDLKEGNKLVKAFHDGFEDFLVTDDGDFFGVNNFRVLVYRNNGNTDGDATNVAEIGELLQDHPIAICQIGADIYIAGGRKVMKTDAKTFKWAETASLAGNGLKLYDGALAGSGTGFAYISDGNLNRFARFNVAGNAPTLMKKLSTGINVGRKLPLTVETASNIYIDSMDNVWMVESSGAGFVVVHNPRGIAGLKSLAGKFVQQK